MLIRSFKAAEENGQVFSISHGKSSAVRVLTKSDGLGFSLSEARCGAGNTSKLWYKNHWEANYIRAGRGSVLNTDTGESWELVPGVLYCVGPNDRHSVINSEDPLRIVSIFNPPIVGHETHDEDGAYPATGEIPPGQEKMFIQTPEAVRAQGGEKILGGGAVTALRLLTSHHGLGFSMSEVSVSKGTSTDLWYKNHWEANLVLEGVVKVIDKNTNQEHLLEKGDVYCVGPNDPHRLEPQTDIKLVAIFNPPLTGEEQHDSDGAYPPTGAVPPGPQD